MNTATGITLGIIGGVLTDVTDALSDGKVTLGEVFDMAFGVADSIGSAFPKWTATAYRLGGENITPKRIVDGFGKGLPLILNGFGARDWNIGKV